MSGFVWKIVQVGKIGFFLPGEDQVKDFFLLLLLELLLYFENHCISRNPHKTKYLGTFGSGTIDIVNIAFVQNRPFHLFKCVWEIKSSFLVQDLHCGRQLPRG